MSVDALSTPAVAAVSARDLFTMTKPRITMMVGLTALVGYLLAAGPAFSWWTLAATLLGTALLGSAATVLNQVLEADVDAKMHRTAGRPIPAGRVDSETALLFGAVLAIGGMLFLAWAVNLLTAVIGALTLAAYVFVYTPWKRRNSLATLIGAVPGAMPPMMGVAGATGELNMIAWTLFAILFLWQLPHFFAIAWMYREDYARGGLAMISVGDENGTTARQMILYAAALLPVSLLPNVFGISGNLYFAGAVLLSGGFLASTIVFGREQTNANARRVLFASLIYLPLILTLMVANQVA